MTRNSTGQDPAPWPCTAMVGHNLLLRLNTRRQDVLRFLGNLTVPFTNNLAERNGRVMQLRQKISSGFPSEDRAKVFVVIHLILSTARKQGWKMLQTLTADRTPGQRARPGRFCADAGGSSGGANR